MHKRFYDFSSETGVMHDTIPKKNYFFNTPAQFLKKVASKYQETHIYMLSTINYS